MEILVNVMSFEGLNARYRQERHEYSDELRLRLHRALSWLRKADQCDDLDSQFIFLWIAFNAAYAQEFENRFRYTESDVYRQFLEKAVSVDRSKRLEKIVWSEYANTIRSILNNEFILPAYWQFQMEHISEELWKDELIRAKAASNVALSKGDTAKVLSIVFRRLYTLRNQIIHGGSTYCSSANRQQMKDCTSVLQKLVPVIIDLMMDGNDEFWGQPVYPLVTTSTG